MDELPQLFQDIEFHVVWKGYDSDEVDAYVDRVAKAAALVHGRVTELQQRAEAAETRAASGGGSSASSETEETLTRTLILAQRTADAAIAEAKAEAAQLIATAEGQAQIALSEARSSAAAVTKDADDHVSRVKAEAETDRRSLLADAEVEAAAVASSEHERLAGEVAELEQYRAFLMDDVDLLERHLREQRSVLAASVSALSDLVERPDAFRIDRAPETSGVVPPPGTHIDLADADEPGPELDAVESADDIDIEPMPVVAETALEPASDPEPEVEPEPEAVHEPALEMPPVIAVDGDVEFVDVTPVSPPVAEEPVPEPIDVAEVEELWTAPVAAWDEPSFASEPAETIEPAESAPDLIDLTAPVEAPPEATTAVSPEEPLHPVFDPRDLPTLDTSGGPSETATAQLEVPAPPLLVTAADIEPSAEDATEADKPTLDEPTAPMPIVEDTLFAQPAEDSSDPFLDQLRDAVAFDDVDLGDDALAAFFDHDDDAAGRGWFGRKR